MSSFEDAHDNFKQWVSIVETKTLCGQPLPTTFNAVKTLIEDFACEKFPFLPNQFKILENFSSAVKSCVEYLASVDEEDAVCNENDVNAALKFGLFAVSVIYYNSVHKSLFPSWAVENLKNFHDALMSMKAEKFENLQQAVAFVCEQYILHDSSDNTGDFVPQTLCFLLLQSLKQDAKLSDVKRIYSLRNSFKLFDYEDESSNGIKQMLIHTLMNATYLRCVDGKKFCAFLFQLGREMVEYCHAIIKNQIPNASKSLLSTFADIYFKAWKNADSENKQLIEHICIQDLMNLAVHCQRRGGGKLSPSRKLGIIMEHFHAQKKFAGVDEMLYRLYEPILWRALNVANSDVRCNALTLLIDAFPIQNPNGESSETDDLLQKQFDNIMLLLKDPAPSVRAIAAQGLCKIFAIFWEVIPSQVLADLLQVLAGELAFDSSSPEVRQGVINGFKYLIENMPLCHTAMKRYLKKIGKLIHDSNPKNREAFLDLLLLIKGIPDIKFWDIVEIDHLLYRLEMETNPKICSKTVELLQNSFFPSKKNSETQLLRCIVLLEKNFEAARKFYFYCGRSLSFDKEFEFVSYMYKIVHTCVKNESKNGTDELASKIMVHFELILDINSILVHDLIRKLTNTSSEQEKFINLFEQLPLGDLIQYCKSSVGLTAIFNIAKHAVASNLIDIAQKFNEILYVGNEISTVQKASLECIFNWGSGEELIQDFIANMNDLISEPPKDHHSLILGYMNYLITRKEAKMMMKNEDLFLTQLFDKMSRQWKFILDNYEKLQTDEQYFEFEFAFSVIDFALKYYILIDDGQGDGSMKNLNGLIIFCLQAFPWNNANFWEAISELEIEEGKRLRFNETINQMMKRILSSSIEILLLNRGTCKLSKKLVDVMKTIVDMNMYGFADEFLSPAIEELIYIHLQQQLNLSGIEKSNDDTIIDISDIKQFKPAAEKVQMLSTVFAKYSNWIDI